jgi:ATP-dependent DNA ligase
MHTSAFEPCIPTRGTTVPAGRDWIHEIKHDGYRLIVQRDGRRVRRRTCNGQPDGRGYSDAFGDWLLFEPAGAGSREAARADG